MDGVKKRLLSRKEASDYVGLGLSRGVAFCNQAGARIQVGGRVLYDREKIDRYIDKKANETK